MLTDTNVPITLVDDTEKLGRFLTWLGQSRSCLAVDTETEGLEFWKCGVRLVQVGDTGAGWAFPWERWAGPALAAISEYDGPIVMHNAKFDTVMIEHHTKDATPVPRGQLHDTMVMGHLVAPHMPKALKALCVQHIGGYASTLQQALDVAMTKNKWTWATVPIDFPMYWGYACIDTVLTARLFDVLHPQVESSYRDVYELEMAVVDIIGRMERRGAPIDLVYCAQARDRLGEYVETATRWCVDTYGFRPGSNKAVTSQLLADGVELVKRTKTGQWALDDEVLEGLENSGNPLATTVRAVRKATKIKSTYFDNFISMHDNHVLHPSINQLGARTGRMSVNSPALQTLPRGPMVRDAFVASTADHSLVMADSDQIEMRLLAHFCQDPGLIAAINEGDLHTNTARRVYGDPTIGKKDPRRQTAKNAAFAKVYMAGVEKFAITAGIPVTEARAFLNGYDQQFPHVKAFQKQVDAVAQQRFALEGEAYVVAPSGRRHVADNMREAYKLVNYLIQGTAADVLKQQLRNLDLAGMGPYMTLPVHDEVVFDIPTEHVDEAIPIISQAMNITEGWAVPITAGVDGPYYRWGDKYRE